MPWELWALLGIAAYMASGITYASVVRCWMTEHRWMRMVLLRDGERGIHEKCIQCQRVRDL